MARSTIGLMLLLTSSILLSMTSCSNSSFVGPAGVSKDTVNANTKNGITNGYIDKTGNTANGYMEGANSGGLANGNVAAATAPGGANPYGLADNTLATGPSSNVPDNSLFAANTADVDSNGNLLTCPPRSQNILILDFKSGWWAGDGGDFVKRITGGLTASCGGTVTLEYHHIILNNGMTGGIAIGIGGIFSFGGNTAGSGAGGILNTQLMVPSSPNFTRGSADFTAAMADPTWNSYNEIWLLSGSEADPMDLPVSNSFFQQVLQKAAASKANFFIGVGFGSISHAVALASTLNIGATFSTLWPEGDILSPMDGVQVVSMIPDAALFSNSLLIKSGNLKKVVDQVIVGGVPAHGDQIMNLGGFDIIAKDNTGQNTLAVSKSATRKVVIDADLPRYYGAWNGNASNGDTMHLLQNILVYLAQ